MRLLFTVILAFLLIGCQSAPAGTATASATRLPSATALPSPTATPEPTATQTVVPTPTVSPAELNRRAGPVCEQAFSALVEIGPLAPPFAVLKKRVYADSPAWELSRQLPHMGSFSATNVQTVFCISETQAQTGTYTDGSAAYQLFWEVRVVSWPGGKVIGKNSFTGSPPPETKVFASGAAEGSTPYDEFAEWILNQIEHPDFLYSEHAITTLAVSPNGHLAAFGTAIEHQIVDRDFQAQIYLFDPSEMQTELGTSSYLEILEGHQGIVTSTAFSPDGKILASSGYDFFIKFWDVDTGSLLGQVSTAEDTPNFLVFSPDGSRLAVATNLQIMLIDPVAVQIERSIPEASGNDLVFSPDGSRLYARSSGSIKIINPDAGKVTLTFPDPATLVPTITFGADGNVESVTYEIPGSVDGFALSPDGSRIFSYTIDRSAETELGEENVRLATWDAITGKYLGEIRFLADSEPFISSDLVETIKISPDGAWLASGYGGTIWLWDTATWQVIKEFRGHISSIEDILFTPDGTRLLSAARDGTIRVWSLEE